MANKKIETDFWADPYFRKLNDRGKLAYIYALWKNIKQVPIILEDMSLATGLEVSECEDWVDDFIAAGILAMEGV
jgi:hypothetical protein